MTRRATRDGDPAVNVTFRGYPEDIADWKTHAIESGTSLSAWITKTLKAEVERARRGRRKP